MIVGILRETFPGERRVALVPATLPALAKAGLQVVVESGAGTAAGLTDTAFTDKGAKVVATPAEVYAQADVIAQVRTFGSNPDAGRVDLGRLRKGQIVIGFVDPLSNPRAVADLASRGVTTYSMELMPRITKAQSMDALSSMATVAGYEAVLLAASRLPRMFPMLMTAAGTLAPAKVLVIGAGVAGLQAIAISKRLGAVVEAYDVRPAVKEQVQSLGAKFVELPLETAGSEDKGGYAKAQDETFYRKQRELLGKTVAANDVVITTAAVPGAKSPVLVTADMVARMAPGSVIVDLAAERGGNCELTRADEEVSVHGVTILGPTNLASAAPFHASQMYGKNMTTLLLYLVKDGAIKVNLDDDITRETLLTLEGQVVHPRIKQLLDPATAGADRK